MKDDAFKNMEWCKDFLGDFKGILKDLRVIEGLKVMDQLR